MSWQEAHGGMVPDLKTPCNCRGWSDKYHCRDGISWYAGGGEQYQAHPPGAECRCYDDECCAEDLCRCAVQVSPVGTFLVVDGVVHKATAEPGEETDVDRHWNVWTEKDTVRRG